MRIKTQHQQRVEEFMRRAGQAVPDWPMMPDEEVRELRAALIFEEAMETIAALGVTVLVDKGGDNIEEIKGKYFFAAESEPSLKEIADGCADISVVTIGTLSACGIADDRLLQEVDASNLRKFEGNAHKDPVTGKWIKPSDWTPPSIDQIINEQFQAEEPTL